MKTIYLAGGCFWGVQRFVDGAPGVVRTRVGYANGTLAEPTYVQVKKQTSGHAETVEVVFDENTLPLATLLGRFLAVIDPFAVNRQGEDVGEQYRTGVYCVDAADLQVAKNASPHSPRPRENNAPSRCCP